MIMNCTLLQDLAGLIEPVTGLAREAGHRILELFRSDALEVQYKADGTPVTRADQAAHDHIVAGLERLTPSIPVLSEESGADKRDRRRSGWDWHWLVDPLDGTRRFIRGSEEFTVNIALIGGGRPVLGVVDAPALGTVYFGDVGGGAFICEGGLRRAGADCRQAATRPTRARSCRPLTYRLGGGVVCVRTGCQALAENLKFPQVLPDRARRSGCLSAHGVHLGMGHGRRPGRAGKRGRCGDQPEGQAAALRQGFDPGSAIHRLRRPLSQLAAVPPRSVRPGEDVWHVEFNFGKVCGSQFVKSVGHCAPPPITRPVHPLASSSRSEWATSTPPGPTTVRLAPDSARCGGLTSFAQQRTGHQF